MVNDFFGEYTWGHANPDIQTQQFLEYRDPLTIDIPDEKLVDTIDNYIKTSRSWFKTERDLYDRRRKNETYYLGQQIAEMEALGKFKDYEARYADNVIYEAEATLKPIALSRIPDLLITATGVDKDKRAAAEKLTNEINSQLRKRKQRWVLGRAYRHRPIYFTAVIKYRWDKELDDYVFECIHPDDVDVDHSSPDNDVNNMRWVAHHYDMSVKEAQIRFPKAKNKLMEALKDEIGLDRDKDYPEKGLASMIRISEVWYTWYKKRDDGFWETIEGVCWKYKKVILNKMKNPNWDWEGEENLYKYDDEGKREMATEDDVRQAIGNNNVDNFRNETTFNNYFSHPEKPFIFLGYDQLGKQPYDETTRIEQVLLLQDNINKRGKQISAMADTAPGKNVFSTESGLTGAEVEEIDMTNPNQDILLKGEINKVHRHIPGQQPTPALFEDQEMNRTKALAKMGAHATTRGEREAQETATGRQILREADIGKQDDEVSDTIDYASERMARAALQLIKLRYTEPKLKRQIGSDGKTVYEMINRDLVEDGMEVEVRASGTDKVRRKAEAYDMAGMQLIDPYTFFQDIEADDPQGRTEKLMIYQASPALYMEKFVKDLDTQGMADKIAPPGGAAAGGGVANPQSVQQAMADIEMLKQGQTPTPPPQPDAGYLNAFNQFINSPEFSQLPQQIQMNVANYAQQLLTLVQGGGTPQPEAPPAPVAPQPPAGQNVETTPAQNQLMNA